MIGFLCETFGGDITIQIAFSQSGSGLFSPHSTTPSRGVGCEDWSLSPTHIYIETLWLSRSVKNDARMTGPNIATIRTKRLEPNMKLASVKVNFSLVGSVTLSICREWLCADS